MQRRTILACVLAGVIVVIATMALIYPPTRQMLSSPHELGLATRQWAHAHPILAEAAVLAAYIVFTLLALPVWWINVLAGYSFGLIGGTIRCVIASGIAAAITAQLWCYLAGDLAHSGKLTRYRVIRVLESYAQTHGFLVVFLTRLMHLLPFGLSNYIFGMLGIRWTRVLAGTLLGAIPSTAIYVALGTGADWRQHLPIIIIAAIVVVGGLAAGSYFYKRHARHHP